MGGGRFLKTYACHFKCMRKQQKKFLIFNLVCSLMRLKFWKKNFRILGKYGMAFFLFEVNSNVTVDVDEVGSVDTICENGTVENALEFLI